MARQAGVLLPLFSIRTPTCWGVGEIPDLLLFSRWAASAGFSVVQLLPVTEPARGQNSPYSAISAFAVDPVYVAIDDLEDFRAAGGRAALADTERIVLEAVQASASVQWNSVRKLKAHALEMAFRAFLDREWNTQSTRARDLQRYVSEHSGWVDDYSLFVTIHDERRGGQNWLEWDEPLRNRQLAALAKAREELAERILFHTYVQWQLDLQWHAARRAANAIGVELMGDLPFMVATDSADVWSRPFDFRLDARAGVPPDWFSETGQDWGLPVFRWDVMEENGYAWMNERARRNADLFGLYRVDHVAGLYRTYYRPDDGGPAAFIPDTEPAQIANGEKVMAILSQGARVAAEDLGVVPDFIRDSLARCGIPGYRVLRWERDDHLYRDPILWPAVSVATTGTHDIESLADWFDGLGDRERTAFLEIPGLATLRAQNPKGFDDTVRDALLELVYRSGSDLVMLPFQDALGTRERVNVPGTVNDQNWTYRMAMGIADLATDHATKARLRGLALDGHRSVPL